MYAIPICAFRFWVTLCAAPSFCLKSTYRCFLSLLPFTQVDCLFCLSHLDSASPFLVIYVHWIALIYIAGSFISSSSLCSCRPNAHRYGFMFSRVQLIVFDLFFLWISILCSLAHFAQLYLFSHWSVRIAGMLSSRMHDCISHST